MDRGARQRLSSDSVIWGPLRDDSDRLENCDVGTDSIEDPTGRIKVQMWMWTGRGEIVEEYDG